ncbi:MAG: hypothetical protein WKF54_03800 [Nocardioidaceae bacterium]
MTEQVPVAAQLAGEGSPAVKSVALSSASLEPAALESDVRLVMVEAGPVPSKSLAVVP